MTPYYQDSAVTIYHADCREILPQLEPVDLVLTDPPYEAEAHTLQRRVRRGNGLGNEPLSFEPLSFELRQDAAREISRLCVGWALVFCQIEAAMLWREQLEASGMNYRRTCIWVKPDGMPQYSGDRPGMGYETFIACHAQGRSEWNGGGKHGVFIHNKGEFGGLCNYHETQKPLKLIKELVALFSDTEEIVLDLFMGSGTTLRAAKDLGRKAIGIEIEERYCEIAAKRMQQEVLDFEAPDTRRIETTASLFAKD
jgi:site-specific DNA-methyltransferase (adenine-specific)